MNCFEWQSIASEYVDGLLEDRERQRADAHLEKCDACASRVEHYRQILGRLTGLKRVPLPAPLRKAPLATPLPLANLNPADANHSQTTGAPMSGGKGGIRRPSWRRTPWFVRTSVEGIGIAAIILIVVALVPRITQFYQQSFERRMAPFSIDELAKDLEAQQATAAGSDASDLLNAPFEPEIADEYAGDPPAEISGTGEGEEEPYEDIYVGNSEIWRFNVKTDSPREMKPKVFSALVSLEIAQDTPGIDGIEAPGGIQFNLLVPKNLIPELKRKIHDLAHSSAPLDTSDTSKALSGTFTWYRNKSRKRLPNGTARVVIWLSQI